MSVELTKGEVWELRAAALLIGYDKQPDSSFGHTALDKLRATLKGDENQ